jgi:hypothetical protein
LDAPEWQTKAEGFVYEKLSNGGYEAMLTQVPKPVFLSLFAEKFLQHFRAAACQHAFPNLHNMVQLGMIQDRNHRMHGTRLGIIRAIDQALHTGVDQRASAHGAGFNRGKQFALRQTMVADCATGLAQRNHFSVRGWVGVADVAIPPASDDTIAAYYDGAHRHLSGLESALGAAQRFFHP